MLLMYFLFKDLNNLNAGAKGFPLYFRFVGNVDFYDPSNQSTSAVEETQNIETFSENLFQCWYHSAILTCKS